MISVGRNHEDDKTFHVLSEMRLISIMSRISASMCSGFLVNFMTLCAGSSPLCSSSHLGLSSINNTPIIKIIVKLRGRYIKKLYLKHVFHFNHRDRSGAAVSVGNLPNAKET